MPEISDKQREELCKVRDDFLESLRDFIDSQFFIGELKPIEKLYATVNRFMKRQVRELKEKRR